MSTLGEVLVTGRGIERPFRCEAGEHTGETASVNVLKGVWLCYSCHASGVVDSHRVPTPDELASMLEPEQACREYPQSWLALYGVGGYWLDRFPDWVCWHQGLGEDPWTGEGTYPVHTPGGRLAGIGRRNLGNDGPKYRYPKHWSASRSMFGSRGAYRPVDVMLIVEGAADACAGWEVGCPTWATFGSGLHAPQVELVHRMRPRLVLLGQDADRAGERGADETRAALADLCEVRRVAWDAEAGDPAAMDPGDRLDSLIEAVGGSSYGQTKAIRDTWRVNKAAVQSAYVEETHDRSTQDPGPG